MTSKHIIAIATLTAALTTTAFGQWHPEIDKVKGRQTQTQSIQSPRDAASGQATGRQKAPSARQEKLGNFEIQGLKSPRDAASGQATGRRQAPGTPNGALLEFQIPEKVTHRNPVGQGTQQVQPGNSGGTITNQRRKSPGKYANQEVSYRQAKGNEVAVESLEKTQGQKPAVFEPNNEPLWAKQRRNQARTKNQDIEVENDEAHRTRPRATRTETVDHNETLRTKPRRTNARQGLPRQ